ncbi:MAG: hypothetical protein F2828_05265 [Actinobacteria bacterium]|nr:hypothetical protein [Actinomycetota bacterium]
MVRCRRSRVPAVTTWASDRVGCSVFLNNRYYDPTTGVFTSVDPLVGKTGTPYLYAGGNPTTYSDSSGLDACKSLSCDLGQVNPNSPNKPLGDIYWETYQDEVVYFQDQWRRDHLTDDQRLRLEEQGRQHQGVHGICSGLWGCFTKAVSAAVGVVAGGGCALLGEAATAGAGTGVIAGACGAVGSAAASFSHSLLNGGSVDDATMAATDPSTLAVAAGAAAGARWLLALGQATNATGAEGSSIAGQTTTAGDNAFSHGYTYDPRIWQRAMQDPLGHNFPYSFDDVILQSTPVTQADGSLLYRVAGSITGKDGVFEIAVNWVRGAIFHRTFRGGS